MNTSTNDGLIYIKNEKHLWATSTNDNYWTSDSWLSTSTNKCSRFKSFNRYQPSPLSESRM